MMSCPKACFLSALGFLTLAGAAGCNGGSAIRGDKFQDDEVTYAVKEPGPGWEEISIENANVAWFHKETTSVIMVNSHCEGVEDAPLEALTRHLTMGTTDRVVLEERPLQKSRRAALETILEAKMDGVPRKFAILVMKKDGCVYDVVFNAPPGLFAAQQPAYEVVRDRLDVKTRPGR